MKSNLPRPYLLGWIRSNSTDRIALHSLALKSTLQPASRAGHVLAPSFVNRSILSSAQTNAASSPIERLSSLISSPWVVLCTKMRHLMSEGL